MKVYIKSSSSTDRLVGNKFWDNDDSNHDDLRVEFIKALRKYWEQSPYRLKKEPKKGNISLIGLFGTGSGIEIKSEAFPLKKGYYISNLIKDFSEENNIPVYVFSKGSTYYVFSNKYSAVSYQEEMNPYGYNRAKIDKAQQEVYGETSKRRYSITIHIGNFRKEKSSKYVDIAIPIAQSISENSITTELPSDIADLIYSVTVDDGLDNKWNEGDIKLVIKTEEPLSKEQQSSLKNYFLDVFSEIPEEFIRVSIFEHLEY